MTSRERELAAIRHQVPDRIPVDRICIEILPELARHLGVEQGQVEDELGIDGRLVAPGFVGAASDSLADKRRGSTSEPLVATAASASPSPQAERGKEGVRGAGRARPLPPAPSPRAERGCGDEEPGDEWGTAALQDYGTAHRYPLAGATSVAEVERYPWPIPADYDYEGCARVAREWGTRYALRGPYWKPLFCRVASLFGLEEALVKMATEPAVFEAAMEKVTDHTAELCERFLAACGDSVPILCLGDDFATQRGLMMSPADWRRFIKPCLARVFAVGKRMGKVVWFHSCGDVTAVLPDLIDIGADVWETVQLHALPMTARELKRQFGKHLAFFGGVNTQRLPFATPDEVRDEVVRCIEVLGEGGGYLCGPDHHIKPDVPAENAVALFRVAIGFRREGYTARIPS